MNLRTYADALAHAGTSELVSYAGGRSRFITWTTDGQAMMYGVPIVTFTPDNVVITHHGHLEPSTLDGIAYALTGRWRGLEVHLEHRVLVVLGHLGTDVLILDYAGGLVHLGGSIGAALAPAREGSPYGDVQLADVNMVRQGVAVTVTGGHRAYARAIARVVARTFGVYGPVVDVVTGADRRTFIIAKEV